MTGAVAPIAAWALAFAGLALLALTQRGNRQAVYGRACLPIAVGHLRAMRCCGGALLGLSVATVVLASGTAFGLPLAVLLLSAAAYAVMAALAWKPGIFRAGRAPD